MIGGGDGGVARELSYYDETESIDVVEEDPLFIEACRNGSWTTLVVWMIRA